MNILYYLWVFTFNSDHYNGTIHAEIVKGQSHFPVETIIFKGFSLVRGDLFYIITHCTSLQMEHWKAEILSCSSIVSLINQEENVPITFVATLGYLEEI